MSIIYTRPALACDVHLLFSEKRVMIEKTTHDCCSHVLDLASDHGAVPKKNSSALSSESRLKEGTTSTSVCRSPSGAAAVICTKHAMPEAVAPGCTITRRDDDDDADVDDKNDAAEANGARSAPNTSSSSAARSLCDTTFSNRGECGSAGS